MWSMHIPRDGVPEKGRQIALVPNSDERAEIASVLDLVALKECGASLDIRPWKADGLAITGQFEAVVVRTCVVSLEDFDQTIATAFERRCHPAPDEAIGPDFDPLADDPPDCLEPEGIDICALVLEEFALAINPYPRKPGVEFSQQSTAGLEQVDKDENPFAVLKKLGHTSDP